MILWKTLITFENFEFYCVRYILFYTAWHLSREEWWGLIVFKSIEVLKSLIEDLCLKYLVHTSKWRLALLFFQFSLWINFGIAYIWAIYQILDKRIWFTILFFSSHKESCTLLETLIFFRWGTMSQEPYII